MRRATKKNTYDQLNAALDEAELHGIQDLVWGAITPSVTIESVITLSTRLFEQAIRRRRSERAKETHLVRGKGHYSPTFINFLIVEMLGMCMLRQLVPPVELVRLAKLHFETDKYAEKKIAGGDRRDVALDLLVLYPDEQNTVIADTVGVSAARVSQWRRDEKFLRDLEIRKKDPRETVRDTLCLAVPNPPEGAEDEYNWTDWFKIFDLIEHRDSHELLKQIQLYGAEQVALALLDTYDTAIAKKKTDGQEG